MSSYATDFVRYELDIGALELVPEGRKLKSGRMSPYFFNSGLNCTGESISRLAQAYDEVIFRAHTPEVIFGPSYKGSAIAVAVTQHHRGNVGFAYNRKEAKTHGEGGVIIGAPIRARKVFLVDDVMTTGESLGDAHDIVKSAGGIPIGCAIAFDRQERGTNTNLSAVQEFEKKFQIPVFAVATLADLLCVLGPKACGDTSSIYWKIMEYKMQYGV